MINYDWQGPLIPLSNGVKSTLLELNHTAKICAKYHLTDELLNYNLILVRDILHELDKYIISKIKYCQYL